MKTLVRYDRRSASSSALEVGVKDGIAGRGQFYERNRHWLAITHSSSEVVQM